MPLIIRYSNRKILGIQESKRSHYKCQLCDTLWYENTFSLQSCDNIEYLRIWLK